MVVSIRRLVIDSLKPRETTIIDLSEALGNCKGVDEVDITVTEVDARTETTRLILRGSDIDYEAILKVMNAHGATIRSIDEVNVAKTRVLPEKKQCSPSQPDPSSRSVRSFFGAPFCSRRRRMLGS